LPERVASALSASMPPESAREIYDYVFKTPSHFKFLIEKYKEIQSQEAIASHSPAIAKEKLTYAEAAALPVDTQGSLLQKSRANVALYGQSFCKRMPERKEEGSEPERNQRRYDYHTHPPSLLEVKCSQFSGNKRQPSSLMAESEEDIPIQNRFKLLQVQEKEETSASLEANEPPTASTSRQPRSGRGKVRQQALVEDEDAALERAIRDVKLLKQLEQETATKQKIDIDSLIEERRAFVSKLIVKNYSKI